MKKKIVKSIVFICILWTLLFISNNAYALEDVDNYSAQYKKYLQLSEEEKSRVNAVPAKYNVSLKKYNSTGIQRNAATGDTLPERYSLADNYNIKVENQGSEGNCWSFASLETIETYLQLHQYGVFDFSENHLNYLESNLFSETEAQRSVNTGGNYEDFQEYANKKFGPVNETDYPYYTDDETPKHKDYEKSELAGLIVDKPVAYIGEYVQFPSIDKNLNNYTEEEISEIRKQIKSHIMANGALYTSIVAPTCFTNEYYNENTYAAYFPNTNDYRFSERSHAVAIIGWDDNFSKDNFVETSRPEHDGAYIALNSWGREFGADGIYYISYDDFYVETELKGIKEAVTDVSKLTNTKTFKLKDINLYKALKDNFNRKITEYNDEEQTITMLSGIINEVTYLELSDKNIVDLDGIEIFENIDSLELKNNQITSIAPLLSLHKLNSINLNNNQLTTIPVEIKESSLMQLGLANNPITDFSGLQEANSITSLDLEGTGITESDLIYLKNLGIVNLNLSNTSIKDYTALSSLENEPTLHVLTIHHNNDIQWNTIPNSIFSLDISNTNVDESKFAQIPNTNALQSLDISYTNIKDLNIIPVDALQIIRISGNKNLTNIEKIKNVGMIAYNDAEISDLSIFANFTTYELYLASNNITDYSPLLSNQNLGLVDLTNNKITNLEDSENMNVFIDENYIKPKMYVPNSIITIKNQTYEEILRVDTSRDNIFTEVAGWLKSFHLSGVTLEITNATVDYDNSVFTVDDYEKDVLIKFIDGKFAGSTVTFKIEKIDTSNINYIYIDRSELKELYVEGENVDTSKIKVYACYDNDSKALITDYTIEGTDNLQVGENTITIKKGDLSDSFVVKGIARDNTVELKFENNDVYNAVLNQIRELERERADSPWFYNTVKIIIDKDDSNKSIKIIKSELKSLSYFKIDSDELKNLDELKQLTSLSGVSINSKNLEDISALRDIKTALEEREDLMPYEKFLGLVLKNNEKITRIDDDIFNSLDLTNTKISSINNLTNLKTLTYKGNKFLEIDSLLDTLKMIKINISENIKDTNKDADGNVILPEIFKTFRDKNFEIKAYINDQLKDEEYLNAFNKKEIQIEEKDGNLIIKYDDIKDIDYDGKNQFIELSIIDKDSAYWDFEIKYTINYRLLEGLELENTDPVELEEDTICDLSNLVVYKVYSNRQKEPTNEFEYSRVLVKQGMNEIEISYTEDGITKSINVPITVKEHTHEWSEWKNTKEPTTTEEGQKERTCLKNEGHKEVVKIDKLPDEKTPEEKTPEENQDSSIEPEGKQKEDSKENKQSSDSANPITGDKIMLWVSLMGISLLGISIIIKYTCKNRKM